jgi:hypothetical protein
MHKGAGKRFVFLDPKTLRPIADGHLSGQLEYVSNVQRISPAQVADALAALWPATLRKPQQQPTPEAKGSGPIAKIKEKIGEPYRFISQFVDLDERGRGHCPLPGHSPDLRPSFGVNREGGYWVCFHEVKPNGRYLGGDVVDFWRHYRGLNTKEAVRELGQMVSGTPAKVIDLMQNLRDSVERTKEERANGRPSNPTLGRTTPASETEAGGDQEVSRGARRATPHS